VGIIYFWAEYICFLYGDFVPKMYYELGSSCPITHYLPYPTTIPHSIYTQISFNCGKPVENF
jgi:hypothetical protein